MAFFPHIFDTSQAEGGRGERMSWLLVKSVGEVNPLLRRSWHGLASVSRPVPRFVLFGGFDGAGVYYNDVYSLQLGSRWDLVQVDGPSPAPRNKFSMCAIDSKIYLYGGYDGSKCLADLWVLDTAASTWNFFFFVTFVYFCLYFLSV